MPESDISESDIREDIEDTLDPRKCCKELTSIIDRHSEDIRDIFSLEFYIECFGIIPRATTALTFDIDIWEEVHLYLLHSASFTHFTSSSFCIEGEPPRAVPSFQGFMSGSKNLTNIGKYSCICGNIRVWCFPNRGLVDNDRFIHIFQSFDTSMFADWMCRSIEVILECDREDVDDK